jgi:hypothetical protein
MVCLASFANLAYADYDDLYRSEGVCGCLDDCNSIDYEIKFVNTKLNRRYNRR